MADQPKIYLRLLYLALEENDGEQAAYLMETDEEETELKSIHKADLVEAENNDQDILL